MREEIAGIDCLRVNNDSKNLVIMIHGYGASFHDLYPLHNALMLNAPCDWIFPNGILEVPIGPMMSGRAWFPIDMTLFEEAIRTGTPRDFSGAIPAGFASSFEKLTNLINLLSEQYDKIIVSGFSQGAMLTSHLMLDSNPKVVGAMLLSASLVSTSTMEMRVKTANKFPIYQSHGNQDDVLDVGGAINLNKFLTENGFEVKFDRFTGGHEIPYDVMDSMTDYINNLYS